MPSTHLLSYDGTRFEAIDTGVPHPIRWLAWRPDGAAALAVGNRGTVLLFDGKRFAPLPSGTVQNLRGVAWTADGTTALLVGNRGTVLRLRGEQVEVLPSPTMENLRRAAWHPDGGYALLVGNAGTLLRSEASGIFPLPGERAHTLRAVAFRPDGAYALVGAYASRWAGYPRPHPLYRCDGRYLQSLLTSDDEDDFVAIDWRPGVTKEALIAGYAYPEGGGAVNKLLTYDGSGFTYRSVRAPGLVLGAGWHPSGEFALLAGEGGTLLRFDGSTLEPLATNENVNLVGPFWKPDGSHAIFCIGPAERVYTV